jgi:hypothetical protein
MILGSAAAQRKKRQKWSIRTMKLFHSPRELGWVAAWVGFIIFLFAIFIPTVNRSLNL